nr:caffeoyl-coa o-methyltransferase [Quercus suber]
MRCVWVAKTTASMMEPPMTRTHPPHNGQGDENFPMLDAPYPTPTPLLEHQQSPDAGIAENFLPKQVDNDPMAGHLFSSTSDEVYFDAIDYADRLTVEEGLPNLDVSQFDGRFLQIQCMMLNATHVLEVGTMGGASSIWLASSSPHVKVMSVYTDSRRKHIAQKALDRAKLADRIEIVNGEGAEVLPVVRMYVLNGHREKFGLVYIHGEIEHREAHLDKIIPMCREGALIIVDNVVRDKNAMNGGPVLPDANARSSRSLMEAVGRDPRIRSTFIPTVGGTERGEGFLVCFVVRTELKRVARPRDYTTSVLGNSAI